MQKRDLNDLCCGNRAVRRYFNSLPTQMQLRFLDRNTGADVWDLYRYPEPTDVQHRAILLPGTSDFLFPFRG